MFIKGFALQFYSCITFTIETMLIENQVLFQIYYLSVLWPIYSTDRFHCLAEPCLNNYQFRSKLPLKPIFNLVSSTSNNKETITSPTLQLMKRMLLIAAIYAGNYLHEHKMKWFELNIHRCINYLLYNGRKLISIQAFSMFIIFIKQ